MSYKEKVSLTNIVSSIVITSIYAVIMLGRYNNGLLDDSNIIRMWAIIFMIFIPISIVARIIIMIIYHIGEAVVQTAKGNELEEEFDDVTDERDKLIDMKTTQYSMYIFAFGFIAALATQLFDVSNHLFFLVLFVFGFLSDLISEVFKIVYYRKGV